MPDLRFALFVKRLFALLTGGSHVCFICSRLFLKFCLGKPPRPPGTIGHPAARPMNNMCFYRVCTPLWIMVRQRGTTICLICVLLCS